MCIVHIRALGGALQDPGGAGPQQRVHRHGHPPEDPQASGGDRSEGHVHERHPEISHPGDTEQPGPNIVVEFD